MTSHNILLVSKFHFMYQGKWLLLLLLSDLDEAESLQIASDNDYDEYDDDSRLTWLSSLLRQPVWASVLSSDKRRQLLGHAAYATSYRHWPPNVCAPSSNDSQTRECLKNVNNTLQTDEPIINLILRLTTCSTRLWHSSVTECFCFGTDG